MVVNDARDAEVDEGRKSGVTAGVGDLGDLVEWIFHDSLDAILFTAPDGRIFRANPAAIQLFGRSEEEICKGGREALVDKTDPRLAVALRQREQTGTCRSQLRMRLRDGSLFPAEISSAVFHTPEGSRTAMVIRDLRPQKELEAQLAHERERFRLLAENALDIVYRYKLEPKPDFDYISPAVTAIVGYTPEEHYADPNLAFKVVHPDDLQLLEAIISGKAEHAVLRWIHKDGSIRWTEHRATPIRDAAGRTVAIEGIARDVTEQKRMEQQLARERAGLQLLSDASASMSRSLDFEVVLAAIVRAALPNFADYCTLDLLDERGEFERVIAAAVDPAKQALMQEATPRYGPRMGPPHPSAVAVATQKPVVLSRLPESLFEELIPDQAERQRLRQSLPVASLVSVPLTARDRCFGVLMLSAIEPDRFGPEELSVVEELGRRASQFLDNARLYQEAQRALAARDEVLAVVAHDLRNPLNAMALRAQMLQSKLEPPHRERVESILREIQRMNSLIDDLMDVARCEAGALSILRAPADPERLVIEAHEMFSPLAAKASVELVVEVEPGLPSIKVDRKRMLQILSNLIGNALKFSRPGTSVRLEVRRGEDEVEFCVVDQGPGIRPQDLPHVFDRFWQGDRGTGGLGLGLSITRALIELQAGRVWVESEVGVGTRMHFAIPC